MGASWDYSLFGCLTDCQTCILGMICPGILYGQTQDVVKGTGCCVPCLMYNACIICYPLIGGSGRKSVRQYAGGIPGDCIGDCCTHLFCSCCALIQENRQAIKARNTKQTVPTVTYIASPGMVIAPGHAQPVIRY